MKFAGFLIFISIVLVIYGSVNYYIFVRGLQTIPKESPLRIYYVIIFIALALSFWAGRILENNYLNGFVDALVWIGSFWLAFMLYFFLFILLFDVIRLVNYFFNFYPDFVVNNYERIKMLAGIFVLFSSIIIVTAGYINFLNPRVRTLNITMPKKNSRIEKLNIVAASDIHLGAMVRNSRVDELVDKINSLKPDIILLPGDIIDEVVGTVVKLNLGEQLKKLSAKYGVYGITGNHEYIGGVEQAVKYLEEHGVIMIRDSAVLIDSSFYVIGREDLSGFRFGGRARKELGKILENVDKNYPMILLDHQPFKLEQAQQNGIDLQLSGHTHHGQLWPFNYLTEMIYEISWGYGKKGNTHYYVSSGLAGWGPPVRIGSRTEIVNIKIEFGEE